MKTNFFKKIIAIIFLSLGFTSITSALSFNEWLSQYVESTTAINVGAMFNSSNFTYSNTLYLPGDDGVYKLPFI